MHGTAQHSDGFSFGAHGSFSFPHSYYPPKDGRAGGIASPFLALTAHTLFLFLALFLFFLLRTIMNRYGAYLAKEHYVSGEIVQQHSNGMTSNVYDHLVSSDLAPIDH